MPRVTRHSIQSPAVPVEKQQRTVKKKYPIRRVIRSLFGPIDDCDKRKYTRVEPTWCKISEMRLYEKLITIKPAGINKHFGVLALTDFLNTVYENEQIHFEDYLEPRDLALLKERKKHPPNDGSVLQFEPIYSFRPTPSQVKQKLNEMYDMNLVEENEDIPEALEQQMDFFLPDGEYGEIIKRREDAAHAPPRRKSRRHGTPDSIASRCSTPAQKF